MNPKRDQQQRALRRAARRRQRRAAAVYRLSPDGPPRRALVGVQAATRRATSADRTLGRFGPEESKREAFDELAGAAVELRRASAALIAELANCRGWRDWEAVDDDVPEPGSAEVRLWLPPQLAAALEDGYWQARQEGWALCRATYHARLLETALEKQPKIIRGPEHATRMGDPAGG